MQSLDGWLRSIVGTVGLLGLLATLLVGLYRFDVRLDLTANKAYSLSGRARNVLAGLETDVEMIAFLRGQNPRNPYIRDLLRRFANASEHVRWDRVDVNRSPAKAHQYGVSSYGAVVVKSGPRRRVVTNPREETLLLAVLEVTRPGPRKTVYFVSGHGEKTPAERDRQRGYSMAAALIGEELYQVRVLSLPRTDSIPEDATVLIIGGPSGAFEQGELDLLSSFLDDGGGLLVLVDAFTRSGLEAFLRARGLNLPDKAVVDPENRMFGGEFVTMKLPVDGTHPITEGLALAPVFSLPRPIEIVDAPAGSEVVAVLRSSEASWATENRAVLAPGTPRFDPERDRRGPITVGLDMRLAGGGRLVVFGNSEFATNFFLEREGNADLLLNTVDWLANERTLIAPRRPRKAQGTEQLLVLGEDGSRIFWLVVVVMPAIYLAIGFFQFLRRRYASA